MRILLAYLITLFLIVPANASSNAPTNKRELTPDQIRQQIEARNRAQRAKEDKAKPDHLKSKEQLEKEKNAPKPTEIKMKFTPKNKKR